MRYKLWVFIFLFLSFLYGGDMEIHCDKEGAFIYVDNIKKSMISNGMRKMSLPSGIYPIKIINNLDDKWQETEEQTVSVIDMQIVKVNFEHFTIEEKSKDLNLKQESHLLNKSKFKTLGNTVENTQSGLLWQDDENKVTEKTWAEALQYCDELTLANYDDWRLPRAEEFLSVIEYSENGSVLSSIFQNLALGFYWSSSESEIGQNKAFRVYLDLGCTDSMDKSHSYQVKCVR